MIADARQVAFIPSNMEDESIKLGPICKHDTAWVLARNTHADCAATWENLGWGGSSFCGSPGERMCVAACFETAEMRRNFEAAFAAEQKQIAEKKRLHEEEVARGMVLYEANVLKLQGKWFCSNSAVAQVQGNKVNFTDGGEASMCKSVLPGDGSVVLLHGGDVWKLELDSLSTKSVLASTVEGKQRRWQREPFDQVVVAPAVLYSGDQVFLSQAVKSMAGSDLEVGWKGTVNLTTEVPGLFGACKSAHIEFHQGEHRLAYTEWKSLVVPDHLLRRSRLPWKSSQSRRSSQSSR